MKVKSFLMLTVFLCTFIYAAEAQSTKRELKQITLSGRGYDLGLQHGQKLKKEIGEIVDLWKKSTTRALRKDSDIVLEEFFAYANFAETIKKLTPELYHEVRGIANGSGQRFNDIMVLNLLDEFWVFIENPENHHCSDVGVPSVNGSPSYIAQNMDIETYTDGYQTLIRLEAEGDSPEQLILTHPGLIALNGMNEKGVGVCVNTIMQLKASSSGLPVAFMIRKIIDSTKKEDILNFVKTSKHASGQNYIIGIRGEVYDFEASTNKVVRFKPDNENGTVYHTNHPIVNDDIKPRHERFAPNQPENKLPVRSNSYVRLDALQKRMNSTSRVTDDLIKKTLRSKDDPNNPVCVNRREGRFGFTFASVIMTLTGQPYLQITPGPGDESEYKRVDFEK
ncbi:MAG: hypothetical protein HEP71_13130 [Roseivirga sp.]|nr:hypothetical protein [Roseivirga sp.]